MEISASLRIRSAVVTAMLVGVSCKLRALFSPVTMISARAPSSTTSSGARWASAGLASAATAAPENKKNDRIIWSPQYHRGLHI
jgi:hypothetical protein